MQCHDKYTGFASVLHVPLWKSTDEPCLLEDWEACLKEAFLAAQNDLLQLAASEGRGEEN